jgi:hypothetical protein
MSQGKGIQKGDPIPAGYAKVPNSPDATCRKCGAKYVIVYQVHEVDVTLAAQHAAFLSGYLEGEHVDEKHSQHLEVYEPLDWTDSK